MSDIAGGSCQLAGGGGADVCWSKNIIVLNDEAHHDGSRILSAYILAKTNVKVWIITEAADDDGERAATTVLLPEEY